MKNACSMPGAVLRAFTHSLVSSSPEAHEAGSGILSLQIRVWGRNWRGSGGGGRGAGGPQAL